MFWRRGRKEEGVRGGQRGGRVQGEGGREVAVTVVGGGACHVTQWAGKMLWWFLWRYM